ncbi:MAG: hypothetical protein NE330_23330 [Lentisphaeraceae bacterium]|nr:hypothetical protein [Lentisphaeraceae bacterium]
MRYLLLLMFPLFFFTSCGESTKVIVPEGADVSKVNWTNYHKWCGPNNLKRTENFKKVKGAKVIWVGKVYDVLKDAGMEDARTFSGNVVRVKMPKTNSLLSDVTLRMPKKETAHNQYKRGDYILFEGKVAYIGSKMNDHIVEVTKYKKVKLKKSKQF